jgi:hypothetical protein
MELEGVTHQKTASDVERVCEEALRVTRCDWAMRRVIEGG